MFYQTISRLSSRLSGRATVVELAAICLLSVAGAQAQTVTNILANPGAESGSFSGWTLVNNSQNFSAQPAATLAPHSGAYSFQIFGDYDFSVATNLASQSFVTAPGKSYSSDGWAYVMDGDSFTGGNPNTAYIEVTFRNSSSNILSRYRSRIINGTFPSNAWINLPVTNQYNPSNETLLGTVTSLVAPANSASVRYDLVYILANNNFAGTVYWDDLKLATAVSTVSRPTVSIIVTNSAPIIKFTTQSSFTYTVQFKNTLTNMVWTNLVPSVTGDGTLKSVQDTSATGVNQRYYRVSVQ